MDSVYLPAEDSFLMRDTLIEYLKTANPRPKTVLDMGMGSGILAIAAAKAGCSVTAADINPAAIKFAKENARNEKVKIDFILSDLFENIKNKFDLILFNPPYVKTEDSELETDLQARAWAGGADGMQVINRFLSSARNHLNQNGKILLLVSSNDNKFPEIQGYTTKLLKKNQLFFEQLLVLELIPR